MDEAVAERYREQEQAKQKHGDLWVVMELELGPDATL